MIGPFTNPNIGFSSIWKINLFDFVDVINRKVLWIFGEVGAKEVNKNLNRTILNWVLCFHFSLAE